MMRGSEPSMSLRVLSVASEVFPFIKTGGLADVAGALALCQAQTNLGGGGISRHHSKSM